MTHFVQKAAAAYAGSVPAEILALAEECDRTSQNAAAKKLGYSAATISGMLGNSYPGDRDSILDKVRGALMGENVTCPVLGEIGRDRCLSEQKKPFSAANSVSARLYRACRATGTNACPHSKVRP